MASDDDGRRVFRCTVAPLLTAGLALAIVPWLVKIDGGGDAIGFVAAALATVVGLILVVASQLLRTVEVDGQGIHIRRWGEVQFLGFGSVDHIRMDTRFAQGRGSQTLMGERRLRHSVVIGMKTGPSVDVDPNDGRAFFEEARRRLGAWVDGREQREAIRIDPTILEPAGRRASIWRQEVRALRADPWDYRQVGKGFDDEGLWLVVEDDAAPAGQRIGAALALRPAGEDREHLRRAARGAPAELNGVLQRIADAQDEAALDEALEAWLGEVDDGGARSH